VGVKFTVKTPITSVYSLPYASYNMARITVAYTQPPFDILLDSQLIRTMPSYRGQEVRRWTYWAPKPYVDLLEIPGGTDVFDVPSGTTVGGVDLSANGGRPINPGVRIVLRAQKSTKKLVWKDVPVEFTCDVYGQMKKIE